MWFVPVIGTNNQQYYSHQVYCHKMKKFILFIVILQGISLSAQVNSRNGHRFAPKGTIRALVVFAEALNDTLDPGALGSWQPGQMPPNPGSYFDHVFTNPNSVSNYVTKYFYEASHDSLIILGDYINTLIQFVNKYEISY